MNRDVGPQVKVNHSIFVIFQRIFKGVFVIFKRKFKYTWKVNLYHKFDAHLKELEKLSAPERALILSLMKTINAAHKG